MKTLFKMAVVATMAIAAPAMATPVPTPTSYTFDTVGSSIVNGTYGNSIAFNSTTPSTLKLSVTAWQSNLFTNTITPAYLGAYSGGLGVTGKGDAAGAYGLHQIDNLGFYTDFVLLEFNRPVTLTSLVTNSYGVGGLAANNAVWYGTSSAATSSWDSTVGFANSAVAPAMWGNVPAGTSGEARETGSTAVSSKWLVGATVNPFNGIDAFKLSSITVADPVAAVPEPATWGMMIFGFGVAGVALRRKRAPRRSAVSPI